MELNLIYYVRFIAFCKMLLHIKIFFISGAHDVHLFPGANLLSSEFKFVELACEFQGVLKSPSIPKHCVELVPHFQHKGSCPFRFSCFSNRKIDCVENFITYFTVEFSYHLADESYYTQTHTGSEKLLNIDSHCIYFYL